MSRKARSSRAKAVGHWVIGLTALFSMRPLAAQTIDWQAVQTVELAEERFARLATRTLAGDAERFVNYTTRSGIWRTQSDATWTSGFVPGSFWYLYALSGEARWSTFGQQWTEGVRSRAYATDNDTGFQIMEAFGTALEVGAPVDEQDYAELILEAAEHFTAQRWNPTIGAFRGWDSGASSPYSTPFEVIVDMMMNLELVLWAGENGGSPADTERAVRHADGNWQENVRADGSTYHVVEYALDGSVARKRTHQGWTTESTWSRGQAWAVYGYTLLYRYTGLPRMLERAKASFDYFVHATDADAADTIPFSDFDAPLDERNPRDSSAAAVVASAALELYGLTGEAKYWDRAMRILGSLMAPPYLTTGTAHQALLGKASEKWGEPEVGAIFADFYLLEAIWRYWNWFEADLGTWRDYPVLSGHRVDTGEWLGPLFVQYEPYVYLRGLGNWTYFHDSGERERGEWVYFFRPR